MYLEILNDSYRLIALMLLCGALRKELSQETLQLYKKTNLSEVLASKYHFLKYIKY